jgi:hypothetical protein
MRIFKDIAPILPPLTRMKHFFERFALYPLLFSVYPALALLATNIDQIKAATAVRAVLVCLTGAAVLLLLLQVLLRNWPRAALISFWLMLLFFSYGHVYSYLELHPLDVNLGNHTLLFPLWLVLWISGIMVILKKVRNPAAVVPLFNLITFLLLAFPVARIILYNARLSNLLDQARRAPVPIEGYHLPETEQPPDIYYIILDAYSRDDDLLQYYQFDNTPFINELENLGFYVARCTQSNYAQTELSLSSSLNYDYLDALGEDFTFGSSDRSGLWPLIKHSAIRQVLESLDYTIINFHNNYSWLAWEDADYFFVSPDDDDTNALLSQGGMNSFEIMLLRSTAGMTVLDIAQKLKLPKKLLPDTKNPEKTNYRRVLFTLEKLKYNDVPAMPGPKFIYVHLISPHPPFVFDVNGAFKFWPEDDPQGYTTQVTFINQRVLEIVKGILDHASIPPVIIIQGDHGINGSDPQRRMKIFNAYYLPGEGKNLLYPSISPVNTFRVVLNSYLGGDLALLPDNSLYSSYKKPYNYQEILDQRPGCGEK